MDGEHVLAGIVACIRQEPGLPIDIEGGVYEEGGVAAEVGGKQLGDVSFEALG